MSFCLNQFFQSDMNLIFPFTGSSVHRSFFYNIFFILPQISVAFNNLLRILNITFHLTHRRYVFSFIYLDNNNWCLSEKISKFWCINSSSWQWSASSMTGYIILMQWINSQFLRNQINSISTILRLPYKN